MINHNIKSNWLKILDYNAKVGIVDKPALGKEKVRIPLTPIHINSYILYYLFESFYPKFINDQQNILDMIISNDNKEIIKIYFYQTNKAGIHESFETLPNDLISIQKEDMENVENLFNKIQLAIVKRTGQRISSIRIFKKKAIDLININNKNIESKSINNNLVSLINLIQLFYEEDLFFIYPIPNFYKFIKESINLLNRGFKLSSIYKFLFDITPNFNASLLFYSLKQSLILKIQKLHHESDFSDLFIELNTPEELGININGLSNHEILGSIKKKLKTDKNYLFEQDDNVSFLLDLFESEFPLTLDKLKIFFQKALFGIRSFENKWDMVPRPKSYNNLFRFFTRIFRFNLNLKKLSHWAIPEFFFNIIETNLGLNSKILIIITSIDKKNLNKVEYVKDSFKFALMLEFENRKLVKIIRINNEELFTENKINSIDVIRTNISNKYGYIAAVLNIDKLLISKIFGNFSSKLFNFNPISKFKFLSLFENEYYFNMFPEIAQFKFLKNNGFKTFFKSIFPILIDKHEF